MAISLMQQPSTYYLHGSLSLDSHFFSHDKMHSMSSKQSELFNDGTAEQSDPNQNQNLQLITPMLSQHTPFRSPDQYPLQSMLPRRLSRSPNISDRTPIRHHRSDVTRNRSSSRPEALLAYAIHHSEQTVPSASTNLPPLLQENTSQPYGTQSYTPGTAISPYLDHPAPYYSSHISQSYTGSIENMTSAHSPNFYPPRNTLQPPITHFRTFDPSQAFYDPNKASQGTNTSGLPVDFPSMPQTLESTPAELDVLSSRQKPQCWEHGCNGRQFSTFSNLLRHQREKSGTASKAKCPHCGTEFTRTTARNGHLTGGKCKGLSDSKDSDRQTPRDSDSID